MASAHETIQDLPSTVLVKRLAFFLLAIGHLKCSLCPIRVPLSPFLHLGCLDFMVARCIPIMVGCRITNFAHAEFYIGNRSAILSCYIAL